MIYIFQFFIGIYYDYLIEYDDYLIPIKSKKIVDFLLFMLGVIYR